ncbi:MAG: hypothetical protein ACF788_08980 [Novipirellula sp. JB048]
MLPTTVYQHVLVRGAGDSVAEIVSAIPRLGIIVAVIALSVLTASLVAGRRIELFVAALADRLNNSHRTSNLREKVAWFAGCGVIVLLFDWPAILWGHFESDDYNLLIDNRRLDFPDVIYAVNNDHIYPLGRTLLRVLLFCVGPNPFVFNLLAVLSLTTLIWSGVLFLLEAGVSRFGALLFASLVAGWTMWGELTSGQYILLFHQSFMTAALLVGWATMRWHTQCQFRQSVLIGVLLAYACFTNMAGYWVVGAAIVFGVAEIAIGQLNKRASEKFSLRWPYLTALVLPTVLAALFYVEAYRRPGGPDFLSSAGERGGVIDLIVQCSYIVATAVLSILLAIPHHLADFGVMEFAIAGALSASVVSLAIGMWVDTTVHRRIRLLAVMVVTGGVVAMVALGRPVEGIQYVVPPKYLFMPYTLVCICVAMIADAGWRQIPSGWSPIALKAATVGVVLLWSAQGAASLMGSWGIPFFETTRGGEIRKHHQQSMALAEIRQTLFKPLESSNSTPLAIADIPGEMLCNRYPQLRFPWGYQPKLGYMLDRLTSSPDRFDLLATSRLEFPPSTVSSDLHDQVSTGFLELLRTSKPARELYTAPLTLEYRVLGTQNASSENSDEWEVRRSPRHCRTLAGWEITSAGDATIVIHNPQWKVTRPRYLQLSIDCPDSDHSQIAIRVVSSLLGTTEPCPLQPRLAKMANVEIDLAQIPAFALSSQIGSIHVCLPSNGVYHLKNVRVTADR